LIQVNEDKLLIGVTQHAISILRVYGGTE
jgi:flagellar biogenesis protein FliO